MTEDEFWDLIDTARPSRSTRPDRLNALLDLLDAWELDDLVDFQIWLDRALHRVDTYHLWGAAYRICAGLMSEDGFYYFCLWLVGLGREAFERVAADGDALADLPEIRRLAGRPTHQWADLEWPDLEGLSSLAWQEHGRRTEVEESLFKALDRRGAKVTFTVRPSGTPWDPADDAEFHRRFSRLGALLALPGRAG